MALLPLKPCFRQCQFVQLFPYKLWGDMKIMLSTNFKRKSRKKKKLIATLPCSVHY